MSFDLAVWRRSPTTKTAMIVEAYEALSLESDHDAAALFDTREFIQAVCELHTRLPSSDDEGTDIEFPDDLGETTSVSFYEWTGTSSATVSITGNYAARDRVFADLQRLVVDRDLMLCDAQGQIVYNNRRSYV